MDDLGFNEYNSQPAISKFKPTVKQIWRNESDYFTIYLTYLRVKQ